MKKVLFLILLLPLFMTPAFGAELAAPEVPESGRALMPYDTESFGEGLWSIIAKAMAHLQPDIAGALRTAMGLLSMSVLLSFVKTVPGARDNVTEWISVVVVTLLLMGSSGSMVRLAADTVKELSDYGKLLFPVLTSAMAAQGSSVTSAALYAGTLSFDAVLSGLIASLVIPAVYVFLCLAVLSAAVGLELIGKLRDFCKWLIVWSLKIILYVFTGYMGITGVVSGSADAAALKATKLAISGMVPLVGGILADTSEAVLVGAGVVKSAIGIYGLLSLIAVWISPFLTIGIQYLLLKCSYGLCSIFSVKRTEDLIKHFAEAMGMLLAMTGTVCLFLLIGVICFMKGSG